MSLNSLTQFEGQLDSTVQQHLLRHSRRELSEEINTTKCDRRGGGGGATSPHVATLVRAVYLSAGQRFFHSLQKR